MTRMQRWGSIVVRIPDRLFDEPMKLATASDPFIPLQDNKFVLRIQWEVGKVDHCIRYQLRIEPMVWRDDPLCSDHQGADP